VANKRVYICGHNICCVAADADMKCSDIDRMQDMAEQISKLTEAQQLYHDALSLKERELNVCELLLRPIEIS